MIWLILLGIFLGINVIFIIGTFIYEKFRKPYWSKEFIHKNIEYCKNKIKLLEKSNQYEDIEFYLDCISMYENELKNKYNI